MATTVHGVAIRPGVSRNRRRYTTEALGRSFDRLNARLADGEARPVTMRTFHPHPSGTSASVTSIVGRVTKVAQLPGGGIAYEAVLADTPEAKTAAALVRPGPDGRQHLASVSIRGWWVGETRTDGDGCETGDDLEIDGLDLTDSPGVSGATVTTGPAAETAETGGRHLIFESVEEAFIDMPNDTSPTACIFEDGLCTVCAVTEAAKALTAGGDYADPGYQPDKKRRYPCDTAAHCRSAWAYINKPENQKPYTAAQLKRIKQRIRAAAKKLGIDIANETASDAVKQVVEAYAAMLPEAARPRFIEEAYASVSVGNGPADINVSAYGNDPADLQAVIGRLSAAVVAALDAVDPDGDGDIDLPGDKDGGAGWRESAPAAGANESAGPAANQKGAPTVSTEQKPAEGTEAVTNESIATAVTTAMATALGPLTEALTKLAPAATPAAETAPADGKPATETAPEAKSADETAGLTPEVIEAITAKVRNDLLNESRNGTGTPERKGLAAKVTEESFDLSQLSPAERNNLVGQAYLQKLYPGVAASLAD